MGRTNKTGLDYFPVNIDMDEEDERIFMMEAEFGGARSFGILIKLLMLIYRNGYYYPWTEKEQIFFSRKKNIDVNLCRQIVDFLLQKGFFCKHLFDKYGILTSRGIQKRYFEAVTRRQKIPFIKEFLLLDPTSEINVNINIVYISPQKINVPINNADVLINEDNGNKNEINVDKKEIPAGYIPHNMSTEIHKGEERRVKESRGEESKKEESKGEAKSDTYPQPVHNKSVDNSPAEKAAPPPATPSEVNSPPFGKDKTTPEEVDTSQSEVSHLSKRSPPEKSHDEKIKDQIRRLAAAYKTKDRWAYQDLLKKYPWLKQEEELPPFT